LHFNHSAQILIYVFNIMKRQVRNIPRPETRAEPIQASERRFVNNFFPAASITVTRCNIG